MCILDKYLARKIIIRYISIFTMFIVLHFIIDIFSNLSDFLKTKPPLFVIFKYYLFMTPLICLRVSPFSLLISVLYSLGELKKNNEIISIRSSGISVFRLSFPILFVAIIISFIFLFIQEKMLFPSQQRVETIKMNYLRNNKAIGKKENVAFTASNIIVFARVFDYNEKNMFDVTIFTEHDDGNLGKKMLCKKLSYRENHWIGEEVIEYSVTETGDIDKKPYHWKELPIPLKETPKELIIRESLTSQNSSLLYLRNEIERLRRIEAQTLISQLIITYHQKIADPLTHFFLIFGLIPFATQISKRRATLSALGTGFIFGFVYYALNSFSIALGQNGIILPSLAAWLTPLFFLTLGAAGILLEK